MKPNISFGGSNDWGVNDEASFLNGGYCAVSIKYKLIIRSDYC